MRLDSVKLQLAPERPGLVNLSRLTFNEKTKPSGEVDSWYDAQNLTHGFNSLRFKPDTGPVLQLSAKVLLDEYPKGLGLDTLERAAYEITRTGAVSVTADELAGAVVRTADVTANLDVGRDQVPAYLSALRILSANPRYRFTEHAGTVTFRSKAKRVSHRLTAYAKGNELELARNREFVRAAGMGVYNALSGCLRVERNARSRAAVRDCAGRESGRVTLLELLEGPRQPVADLFDRIESGTSVRTLFDEVEQMQASGLKFYQIEKQLGQRAIIEQCNGDLDTVRELIKRCVKGNVSRYVRQYREVLASMIAKEAADADAADREGPTWELVRDVQQRLRQAA